MIEGFEVRASRFNQNDTIGRLVQALEERNMSVFARVNHAAAAAAVGLSLAPTELFLVGN